MNAQWFDPYRRVGAGQGDGPNFCDNVFPTLVAGGRHVGKLHAVSAKQPHLAERALGDATGRADYFEIEGGGHERSSGRKGRTHSVP
jgi:hypothetical protein